MEEQLDYDRILIHFRRAATLPPLPGSAMALVHAIDSGEATAMELEKIIASDPAIATTLLRIASSDAERADMNQIATLRHAIMVLGQRAIRSLAISLTVKQISHECEVPGFDPVRFARHSLATGYLARYIFVRRTQKGAFESRWNADEIFAAGVLHDLGFGLLARVCSSAYTRTQNFASRFGSGLDRAFTQIYKGSAGDLGAAAAETWNLPALFPETMRAMNCPWTNPDEFVALACLGYADYLAHEFGETTESWPFQLELSPEVEMEVGLQPAELEGLRPAIEHHLNTFLLPPCFNTQAA